MQHLDKSPPGQDTVKVVTSFLGLSDLKYSTAAGIVSLIEDDLGNIGIYKVGRIWGGWWS